LPNGVRVTKEFREKVEEGYQRYIASGAPEESLRDLVIRAAEQSGECAYEWDGRHFVRKWTGEGGVAGYLRTMDREDPAGFRNIFRTTRRNAMSGDVAEIEQIFADAGYSLTVHEFCAAYGFAKMPARRARSTTADAKSRIKALLDSLERGL